MSNSDILAVIELPFMLAFAVLMTWSLVVYRRVARSKRLAELAIPAAAVAGLLELVLRDWTGVATWSFCLLCAIAIQRLKAKTIRYQEIERRIREWGHSNG